MSTVDSLARFREAQADEHAGIGVALAELGDGEKRSHWIWYVFPQWVGLGRSPMARRYAIASMKEAHDFIMDPALGENLAACARALAQHCAPPGTRALDAVLGDIDAMKVLSSLTLFVAVAARIDRPRPSWVDDFARSALAVLDEAERRGSARCEFTLRAIAAERS
ncbi:MAG: DUF1810 family protein [Myxococcales bacterium]|nr:DUF1810 family protein [Myxococcales bacterium]